MNPVWTAFVIGTLLGLFGGVAIMCLVAVCKNREEDCSECSLLAEARLKGKQDESKRLMDAHYERVRLEKVRCGRYGQSN